MYDELVKRLRASCESCKLWDGYKCCLKGECSAQARLQAADAIEKLAKDLERSKEWEKFWEKEANEALRKFQVAIASKPRWIPVTERLPNGEAERYLVAAPLMSLGLRVSICYYADNLEEVDEYDFKDEKHSGFYWYDDEYGYCEQSDVKYWMPLPQPPKGE